MVVVMAGIAGCGVLSVALQVGLAGSMLVIGAATLPPIVLAVLLMILDRMEPEPRYLLVLAFAAGATVSVVVSMVVSVPSLGIAAAAVGTAAADVVGTVVLAPVIEELAKGAILLALFLWRRNDINGAVDGIVYGSMVGLGFAFAENTLYFSDALSVGVGDFAGLFVLRAVFSAFAHPLFTSMTGLGFAIAAEGGRARYVWPAAGLLAAMALHAIWNVSAILGAAWYVTYVLFFIPILLVVVVSGVMAARREAELIRTFLVRDVELGLLSQGEVHEVASLSNRRRALQHFGRVGGAAGRNARAAFHASATRLAFERSRSRLERGHTAEELRLVGEIARHKRLVDPRWVAPAGVE
jgi:RsiW-degrading membrane proteinase PrsW (M82 family)